MGWFNPFTIAKRLREIGLMGIGQRNADYVLMHNPRKFYPRVDDKLLTKKLALAGRPAGARPVRGGARGTRDRRAARQASRIARASS